MPNAATVTPKICPSAGAPTDPRTAVHRYHPVPDFTMKGIAFGLLLTVVAALLGVSLTMLFGGSEAANFLLSLGGALVALALDFSFFA